MQTNLHRGLLSALMLLGFLCAGAQNGVTIYADCGFNGRNVTLSAGRYDLGRTNVGAYQLSSLRIPSGYKVVLYTSTQTGQGNKVRLTEQTSCLPDEWNDKAGSLVIEYDGYGGGGSSSGQRVTLYEDCGYGGRSMTLAPGRYMAYALGVGNDRLSSLRVPYGLQVTLYRDDDFRGEAKTISGDLSCLEDRWNDQTSSIVITTNTSGGSGGEVVAYADCNFSGGSQSFPVGRYDTYAMSRVGNDRISSIKVPNGYRVTVYENGGFGGQSYTYTGDQQCIGGFWNDRISSMVVERGSGNGGGGWSGNQVTLFKDCSFRGDNVALGRGRYDTQQMGIGNDQLSSMKIPSGMRVTVYYDGGFRGLSRTFTSDQYCFGDDWNDKVSSLVIE